MVYSRPIWSEIQPNSGRAPPLRTLSTIGATVSAEAPNKITTSPTLKSFFNRRDLGRRHQSAARHHAKHDVKDPDSTGSGARRTQARRKTIPPWTSPNQKNAAS